MPKTALPFAACLLAFAVAGAHAQALWKWRDASGQLHISDTAPPPGTPAKDIVSGGMPVPTSTSPAASGAATASAGASAPMTPLELKKRAADKEKADKQNAEKAANEARIAAARKDTCTHARNALATLQSGQRMATVNAKGEREYMDDAARAAETRRAQDAVASNCGPATGL